MHIAPDGPDHFDVLLAIVGALVTHLRDRRILSAADAEDIAAEAFNRMRPPTDPDLLGGPEQTERRQLEALQRLQQLLPQAGLPSVFLPKPLWPAPPRRRGRACGCARA